MQVNETSEFVTQAAIGKQEEVIQMTLAADEALFILLSKGLYKQPDTAVMREVLCNAWDAHIDAEVERPVEISFTDAEVVFRDFGKGIPHHMIGPVYGTYGGSTKKHSENQTGGFGLGCKAPFAHTDSFTVTSWNQGIKTTYLMSKSIGEIQGKPTITPVISLPSDETGLEVRIPVLSKGSVFKRLLEKLICQSGIKTMINGELFEDVIDYSKEVVFVDSDRLKATSPDGLFLKYGTVVYPISLDSLPQRTNQLAAQVKRNGLPFARHNKSLVLQAPPDSIVIPPNREDITYVTKTENTINSLLEELHNNITKAKINEQEVFKEACQRIEFSRLTSWGNTIYLRDEDCFELDSFKNVRKTVFLDKKSAHYGKIVQIKGKELPYLNKHFYKLLCKKSGIDDEFTKKWVNRVIKFLFHKVPDFFDFKSLYYVTALSNGSSYGTVTRRKCFPEPNALLSHLVQGIVVVSHNMTYKDRLPKFDPVFDSKVSHFNYMVKRSKNSEETVKNVTQFFTQKGMTVFDLTKPHPSEEPEVVKPKPRKITKQPPKKKVAVQFDEFAKLCQVTGEKIIFRDPLYEKLASLEKPEWVSRFCFNRAFYDRTDIGSFENADLHRNSTVQAVKKLWGNTGGIVRTHTQFEYFVKNGALPLKEFIQQKLEEELTNEDSMLYELEKYSANSNDNVYQVVLRHPKLSAKYLGKDTTVLFKDDRVNTLVSLLEHEFSLRNFVRQNFTLYDTPCIPEVHAFKEKLENCEGHNIIRWTYLLDFAKNNDKMDMVEHIVTAIIEGK